MRCFNHPDVDAVGSCKACSKGLCMECAADLGHGLACKASHVEAVENLNVLVTRNVRIGNINTRGKFIIPLFYGFIGAVFLLSGLITRTRASPFSITMGVGFLVFALVTLAIGRRAWGK